MNTPKLYTVKEAAKIVGVSTNTLYKYLDDGRIHAARGTALQGRFRIPEAALEEFLGIKLSQPEPNPSTPGVKGAHTPGVSDATEPLVSPTSEAQPLQDTNVPSGSPENRKTGIPLKMARFLLFLALVAILVDLLTASAVSPVTQFVRLFFVAVMILLSYQEGGFRRT